MQFRTPTSDAAKPILFERAKDTLLYDDAYKKFNPQGFLNKEEFYIPLKLLGECRKNEESEEYYQLRSQHNTNRYLEMLHEKLNKTSPRGEPSFVQNTKRGSIPTETTSVHPKNQKFGDIELKP